MNTPGLFDTPSERAQRLINETAKFLPLIGTLRLIADDLSRATGERPLPLEVLRERYGMDERGVKSSVQQLRDEYLLPIGSRRHTPAGYFWIHSLKEFQDWHQQYLSQAKTTFATAYKLARRHWPTYAGQLALDFSLEVQSDAS